MDISTIQAYTTKVQNYAIQYTSMQTLALASWLGF